MQAGYTYVEDFLTESSAQARERTGLEQEDLDLIMQVLGDFDSQGQE